MVGSVGILDFAALFCAFLEWDWDDVPLCLWAAMWDHQLSGAAPFYRTSRAAHHWSSWRPRPRRAWEDERVQRIALHDWSDDGRRASFSLGYLSGRELRGTVVLFCEWLILWAGAEARPAARSLLTRGLRWRLVVAGNEDVSFSLIQRTFHTLALEAHHLHRWCTANGYRPRHGIVPRSFPMQARHEFWVGGRCVARMLAGLCGGQQPCVQCSAVIGCTADPAWTPSCLFQRATAALLSEQGCTPEEVWRRIHLGSSVFPFPLRDITCQVPYSAEDWALLHQLRPEMTL